MGCIGWGKRTKLPSYKRIASAHNCAYCYVYCEGSRECLYCYVYSEGLNVQEYAFTTICVLMISLWFQSVPVC